MTRSAMLLSGLAAVLVAALWWLFLYSPGQEELAGIEADIEATIAERSSLEGTVARLEAVRAAAPETEAAIAGLTGIVPSEPALPGALRQLVAAADDAGLEIASLGTARPTVADEESDLYTIRVTMNLSGSYFQTVDFLRRIEDPTVTTRGFVFNSVSLSPSEYPTLTVALTGDMFAVLDDPPDPAAVDEPAGDGEAQDTDEEGEA